MSEAEVGSIGGHAFLDICLQNPNNRIILERLAGLDIPQCQIVAGCLFQTVWNYRSGQHLCDRIADYDIFYFEPSDLSWSAEDAVVRRVQAEFAELPIRIDVKNQARVHLWYQQKFGAVYPPLQSTRDGLGRFLVEGTCVGIDVRSGELAAPYGVDDIWNGRLRMNRKAPDLAAFLNKAQSYRDRWPWLEILQP